MNYSTHSEEDRKIIFKQLGIKNVKELFKAVPEEIRKQMWNLPEPLSEKEIKDKLSVIGSKNNSLDKFSSFIGGGAYNHYIPAPVKAITSISDFYTAYTPYQAEISQGTLQYIFEFQTLICRLTGMEVANASMYDGASALAEAILMSNRINGKKNILISKTIHPEYMQTCKTYLMGKDIEFIELDYLNGITDLETLLKHIDNSTSAVVIQNPNFFGCFEEVHKIKEVLNQYPDCLFIISIVNPLSLALCSDPGSYGADIVTGEAQSFGCSLSFGGPYLGFFATRQKHIRQIPGRVVGKTFDARKNDSYVLTFQTREQHIRKQKATSNICSNHSLNALAASVYLSLVGENGLKSLATVCLQRAHYLSAKISQLKGFKLKFKSGFFNEFAIETKYDLTKLLKILRKHKILGGINLEYYYKELKNCMLVSVTEMDSVVEIDRYNKVLKMLTGGELQ